MTRARRLQSIVMLVMTMAAIAVGAPALGADQKTILVLHSLGYDSSDRFPFDTTFARVMREAVGTTVDLYIETLDPNRFAGEPLALTTREYLRTKYADKHIAAVAVVYDEALAFLLDERDPLFPSVPVAAVLVGRPHSLPDRVSVIRIGNFVSESLSLAVALNPQARQIVVIDGGSSTAGDRDAMSDEIEDQLSGLVRVPVLFLRNLPLDELLLRVRALPSDGIIFLARQHIGPQGAPIDHLDAVKAVARVAPAPLYASTDTMVGVGALGGVVISIERMATELASLALRLSRPGSLPVATSQSSLVPTFDWRELQRWGISERLLPPGSEIRFHTRGLWDQYRWHLVGALSITLLQGVLIAGLVMQRTKRRRVEMALRESEQHFRTMADTAPVLIWRSATDTGSDFFNKPWLDFRGRTFEQEEGSGWTDGLHPDDRESCIDARLHAFGRREPFDMEYRLQTGDGAYRWVFDIGVPRYDGDGRFAGYIGSAVDITAHKLAEQENQDLVGRLITVQEEERTRIARDLHDDLSQQLAGVAIMLSSLKRQVVSPGSPPEVNRTVATLQERTTALAVAMRTLSHKLHPSVLEHAGLVTTLRRLCVDVEEHHPLDVIFRADEHLDSLRPEVALCLFRVTQEALTNAVRHASASTIRVELSSTHDNVELQVSDDGVGFVASERMGSGLGLRSINERVRLTRGLVRLDSRPGSGTTLIVRVPSAIGHAETSVS